jgi:hypothetical protein
MPSRPSPPTLAEVVERVRQEEFPDLPAELVSTVLESQIANSDNPRQATQESERVLRQWLAQDRGGEQA